MKTLTASDRSALIKLASSLPKEDLTRKAILSGLKTASSTGHDYTIATGLHEELVELEDKISDMIKGVGKMKDKSLVSGLTTSLKDLIRQSTKLRSSLDNIDEDK